MIRIKTFLADGSNPNGRLFAGDLNAIQDAAAGLTDLTQALSVASVAIGESGLQIVRFAAGDARVTGALRVDNVLRGLGGLLAGAFTTTARDAIVSPPAGLIILNTTTARYEWNAGSSGTPNWQPFYPSPYEVLMDTTLAANATIIDTNTVLGGNIPQTHMHLVVKCSFNIPAADTTQNVYLRINNDGAPTNYYTEATTYSGNSPGTTSNTEQLASANGILIGAVNGNFLRSSISIDLNDYTNGSQKGVIANGGVMDGTSTGSVRRIASFGAYRVNGAITRLQWVRGDGGNLSPGTRVTIFGTG